MSTSSSVTFRLSDLHSLQEYLNVTAIDLPSLRQNVEQTRLAIEPLKAAYELAEEECKPVRDAHNSALQLKRSEWREADRDALDTYHNYRSWSLGDDESNRAFLARKQDKADRLERECHHLEEEFMSSPENALIVDARRNLDFAQEAAKEAESKLNAAEKLIASAKRFLPDGISHIHRQRLEQLAAGLASMDWDGFEEPSENESLPPAQQAAIVRGEVPCTCSCNDGHLVVKDDSDGVDVFIELDDRIRHPLCQQRSRFDASLLMDAVPASHANLRVHSLGTWEKSPIPVAKQKGPIAGIPSSADGLRGWLMAGPAGTSKTSYAAAAVIDILTFRIVEWQRRNTWYDSTSLGFSLNYWRVKAPKWIRDMEMFETRDFDSDAVVPEPWPTPQLIEKATATSGFKPILWLEELDKFNPTQNRMRNLYTLIDGVYEAGGDDHINYKYDPSGPEEASRRAYLSKALRGK